MAVAFADTYDIVPDPSSVETVYGLYGIHTETPAVAGTYMGKQLFDVNDTTTGTTVGTFEADVSNCSCLTAFGSPTDQELLVTQVVSGTPGTAAGDVPPVGSVLATFTVGSGVTGYSNVYSDLASTTPGADVISDTLVTPFGSFPVPTTFDAAAGLAADSLGAASIPFGGYDIVPDPTSTEKIDGITGLPPAMVAVQGYQQFDVNDPTGATIGSFDAEEATTSDVFGNTTEALLVTHDVSGTAGTAAGDVPPVGSLFNVIINPGLGIDNIYSYLPSPSGGVISDTWVTPYGSFSIPFTFDPAPAFVTEPFQAPVYLPAFVVTEPSQAPVYVSGFIPGGSYGIAPDPASTEVFAGINDLPPLNVAVQGYQLFDVADWAGNTVGTFDGDVTTTWDLFGHYSETILVTSDVTGIAGTSAGDVPPVGSVFEVANVANSGYENIYSDIVAAAGNQISDTLVTPFGSFPVLDTFDAVAGLGAAMFSMLP